MGIDIEWGGVRWRERIDANACHDMSQAPRCRDAALQCCWRSGGGCVREIDVFCSDERALFIFCRDTMAWRWRSERWNPVSSGKQCTLIKYIILIYK